MVVALWGGDGGDDPWRAPPALVEVRHPMVPTVCPRPTAAFTPEGPQVETSQVRSSPRSLASQHRR